MHMELTQDTEHGMEQHTTLETRIGGMERQLYQLNNSVLLLQGSIMSRAEIVAEDQKRVSLERFEGEVSGIRDRLLRLESGPQKMIAWVGVGTGCLSVCIAGVAVLVTALIAIIPHLH